MEKEKEGKERPHVDFLETFFRLGVCRIPLSTMWISTLFGLVLCRKNKGILILFDLACDFGCRFWLSPLSPFASDRKYHVV